MNTAEYIIKRLEELGINNIFGLPDIYNSKILSAVENNNGIKWIGCTNPLNAGYAADGYARINGYGAFIISDCNELAAINALAASMAENIPVICISGTPKTTVKHKNIHNAENSHFETFKSLLTNTAYLTRDNAKLEIDRVLKNSVKEKLPAYIAIPEDIAQMEISDRYPSYEWICEKEILKIAAEKIIEKIKNSKNPIIIGDSLIKRFDALIEYREFVTKSEIPVSNFLMGKNLINADYEKYIGTYFGNLRNPIAQKYIEETDCLISIGTSFNNLKRFDYNLPYQINNHIAIYGNYTYIEGKLYNNIKMSDLLENISTLIEPSAIQIVKPNIGYKDKLPDEEPLSSDYIYSRIQSFIKENDIVITENGTVQQGISQIKSPGNVNFEFQSLRGCAGWATCAALGACAAKPQSRVILITGDGAHIHTAIEIGTILKLGMKPIIIVINNGGYSVQRLNSDNPKDSIFDIPQMNYAKFARIFNGDVWATKVSTKDDFDKALKVTQIMNKMCYIEVCTDKLDIPQLTQDYINNTKEISQKSEIKEDKKQENDDIVSELILSSQGSGFEYETIVHKGFEENINQKDKAEK